MQYEPFDANVPCFSYGDRTIRKADLVAAIFAAIEKQEQPSAGLLMLGKHVLAYYSNSNDARDTRLDTLLGRAKQEAANAIEDINVYPRENTKRLYTAYEAEALRRYADGDHHDWKALRSDTEYAASKLAEGHVFGELRNKLEESGRILDNRKMRISTIRTMLPGMVAALEGQMMKDIELYGEPKRHEYAQTLSELALSASAVTSYVPLHSRAI